MQLGSTSSLRRTRSASRASTAFFRTTTANTAVPSSLGAYLPRSACSAFPDSPSPLAHSYDYEEVESEAAAKVIKELESAFSSSSFVGSTLGPFTVAESGNFSYTDPIDHSISKNQGHYVTFSDGSRFVIRLSGTGSQGATIRLYVEKYSKDTNEYEADTQKGLKPLIDVALTLSKLVEHTGRKEPTVITVRLLLLFSSFSFRSDPFLRPSKRSPPLFLLPPQSLAMFPLLSLPFCPLYRRRLAVQRKGSFSVNSSLSLLVFSLKSRRARGSIFNFLPLPLTSSACSLRVSCCSLPHCCASSRLSPLSSRPCPFPPFSSSSRLVADLSHVVVARCAAVPSLSVALLLPC
jgi:hypothetical protein